MQKAHGPNKLWGVFCDNGWGNILKYSYFRVIGVDGLRPMVLIKSFLGTSGVFAAGTKGAMDQNCKKSNLGGAKALFLSST